MHNMFYILLLEPFYTRDGKVIEPMSIPIDGEPEWLIEKIMDNKIMNGK